MKQRIVLKAVEMTPLIMENLEKRNLIIRLYPGHHDLDAEPGQTLDNVIYESQERFGPHKLIGVTVNNPTFAEFGAHPDNEEFLLLGNPDTKPLYLAIALHRHEQLCRKIAKNELSAADFICLRVKYNDPEVSYFTMLAGVPHGEAIAETDAPLPSFYVTESCDLNTDFTDFGDYQLCVADD